MRQIVNHYTATRAEVTLQNANSKIRTGHMTAQQALYKTNTKHLHFRSSIFSTIVGGFFVFQPATSNLKGLVIIYKTTHNLDEIHSLTLLLMGLLEIFPQVGEAFYKLLMDQFNCQIYRHPPHFFQSFNSPVKFLFSDSITSLAGKVLLDFFDITISPIDFSMSSSLS